MMRRLVGLFCVIFVLAVGAFSQVKVGSKVENFSLPDIDGKSHSLADLKGSKGVVFVFVSIECPVCRGYDARVNQLAKDYKTKGINVVGIDSNITEAPADVKAHALTSWDFPVLIDKDYKVADKLSASVTPEVFYIDMDNTLVYHGAIDNDRSGKNVTDKFLQTAFDSSLAGKKVERTSANAFGCSIKRTAD